MSDNYLFASENSNPTIISLVVNGSKYGARGGMRSQAQHYNNNMHP